MKTSTTSTTTAKSAPWTLKRFLQEKNRQAVNLKRSEQYVEQGFADGAGAQEQQRLLTSYRNDVQADPLASGHLIRPLEFEMWKQALDYSMHSYAVEWLVEKLVPSMQFALTKGDVDTAKRLWNTRERKAGDPAAMLRDAIQDMRKQKWMEPVFRFGSFTIVNQAGITEDRGKHLFEALKRVESLLKSKGLGYLVKGTIGLTHDSKRFDASYDYSNDRIEVNYGTPQTVDTMTRELIHELGHRLWFKFMDAGGRDLFAQQWVDKGEDPDWPETRLPSVTRYGTTNRHEDFAETFTEVVMGKQKDRRLAERLQAVLPKGRVLSATESKDSLPLSRSAEAGVIPIPKREIARVRDELVKQLRAELERRDPTDTLKGYVTRKPPRLKVQNVMGHEVELYVGLKASSRANRPIQGGGIGKNTRTGQDVIVVFVDEKTPVSGWLTLLGHAGQEIYKTLLHEVTHAADRLGKKGPSEYSSDYVNDPRELRAFMQEIVDQATEFVTKYGKVLAPKYGIGWMVNTAVKRSETWQSIESDLTEQNRNRIKKAVYQAIEPLLGVEANAAMEVPFKVGDEVLFGKYKNKRGRIIGFGTNDKGQVTVQIEPVPKGRKHTKEMGLFKIWTTPDAIQAVTTAASKPADDSLNLSTATEYGYSFKTGKPVTFRYRRNTAKAPNLGSKYQQDIEPAGRYLITDFDPNYKMPGWEQGTATFKSPLVLKLNSGTEGIYDDKSWKARLHRHYGKKGRALSNALLRDGYDAIVTTFRGDTREIVALKPDQQLKTETSGQTGKMTTSAADPEWVEKIESGKGTVFIGIDDGEPVEWKSWHNKYMMYTKSKQQLDIEGYSLLAPEVRTVLKKLVKIYPPASKWSVRSDGPTQPIERLLKSRGPKHGMPKHLFHGTSTELLPRIMKEGLKPRTTTSIKPTYQGGAKEGRPERVYFAAFTSLQATHFAAREAARKHGGDPVVLRIKTKPLTKRWADFKADEDSNVDDYDWVRSLYGIGTVAYEGSVPPSAISLYERLADRDWVRAAFSPLDDATAATPLAQQLTTKMEALLRSFSRQESEKIGAWFEDTFSRIKQSRTPRGGKKTKEAAEHMLVYHGTRGPLGNSLVENGLRSDSGFSNFGGQAGVSFTRDLRVAKQFGNFIVAVDLKRLRNAGYDVQDVQHPTAPNEHEVRVTKGRVTVIPSDLFEKVLLVRPQRFELKWWERNHPAVKIETVAAARSTMPWEMTFKQFSDPLPKPRAGYQLLYHYTKSNLLDAIKRTGLKRSNGAVFAHQNYSIQSGTGEKPLVVFQAPKDEVKRESGGGTVVVLHRDVDADDVLATFDTIWPRPAMLALGRDEPYYRSEVGARLGREARDVHRAFVEAALVRGFDVPVSVLREYKALDPNDPSTFKRYGSLMQKRLGSAVAATDELYHTTSLNGLAKILQSRTFKSGVHGGFVSFSEKPLFGDISGNDAVIVLDKTKLRNRVMPVEYTESWYDRYPEHAAYIAGEGWRDQYVEPDDCYDEDGWADDECVERGYRDAELDAFTWKRDEREWIGRSAGDIRLPEDAFKRVVVTRSKLHVTEALIKKLGLRLPVKVLRGR